MSENATPAVNEADLNASIEKLTGLVTEKTAATNERIAAMEKELSALQQAAAGREELVKTFAPKTFGARLVSDKTFQNFKPTIAGNRHANFPRRPDRAGPCNRPPPDFEY